MTNEVIRIEDRSSGASAEVLVSPGFNCFSWKAPFADEPAGVREMLWTEPGFEQGDKRPSRSGIPLLFPFPGRIAGGEFTYEGKPYAVEGEDGQGNAIHGFAIHSPWRVLDHQADRVTAEFCLSLDMPERLGQWTGDCILRATYRVEGAALRFEAEVQNPGKTPLPWGLGTHAYFRLPLADGSDLERTLVSAPIDGEWLADQLVPTGKSIPLGKKHPLPSGSALEGAEYDTPYRFAAGGPGQTELHDPSSGRRLVQTFDPCMTCCVVYTPGHREAVCLEPYTCVPNPFALSASGVDAGLQVLAPGETFRTAVTYEVSSTT